MPKFVFSSNIFDSSDRDLIQSLLEDAVSWNFFLNFKEIFLSDFENNDSAGKAKSLIGASLFIVPAWVDLNDFVRKEIELAKKQKIKIRFISHWEKEDLKELFKNLDIENNNVFPWNKNIFKYWE